jgi:hypothetical protein
VAEVCNGVVGGIMREMAVLIAAFVVLGVVLSLALDGAKVLLVVDNIAVELLLLPEEVAVEPFEVARMLDVLLRRV